MKVQIFIVCATIVALVRAEGKGKLDNKTRFELAQAHYERVLWQVMCGVPQPRVIRMETVERRVLPAATILHRCGHSSGCCDSPLERCAAKKKEKVELFFFVQSRTHRFMKRNGRHRVKKFVFNNHTECHCVDIVDMPK